MSFKIVLFCAQICLIKTAFTQCLGPRPFIADGPGLIGPGLMSAPCGRFESSLFVENYPMPTPGLSIVADGLIIEGLVSVSGSLPFLGTVAIEGALPTEGQGKVVYGCGNGEVAIIGENAGPYGPGFPGPAGPLAGPMARPMPGPMAPEFFNPMGPAFGAFNSPCNRGPVIDPGMAAAANTAAIAAVAKSAGQAAVKTTIGLEAAANASGLTAMGRF